MNAGFPVASPAALAGASSLLLGLGRRLSLVQAPAPALPGASGVHVAALGDPANRAMSTRASKADLPHVAPDRIVSELYPVPAPLERLSMPIGFQARWAGRDPHIVTR